MRFLTDHRLESGGFEESIQGVVRNSPWWMLSIIFHALGALILWNIPTTVDAAEPDHNVQLADAPEIEDIDEPPPPPEPPAPDEDFTDETLFIEDEVPEDPIEVPLNLPEGPEGPSKGPFEGPSKETAIGPGGGGGGGGDGPGGMKSRTGPRSRVRVTEGPMELGLKWLADHQDVDGRGMWDCDGYMKHDPPDDRCDGPGKALYDPGVTGLAVLAFLGAGYTDRGTKQDNPYARNVRSALRYLATIQDDEGCFGPRNNQHFVYNHALAALAMCEAWAMTRNPVYKKPAQRGLDFIAMARNPYLAWRYGVRPGDNDMSVTAWMVMALKSGKFGGLDIDPDAFVGARTWVDKMTDPDFGITGYLQTGGSSARPEGLQNRFPAEKTASMTAAGILTRIFLGESPRESRMVKKGVDQCLKLLPVWDPDDGSIDMYYWYYGTLALFQVGGQSWKRWNKAMVNAIVKSQNPRGSGSRTGSWDPIGAWGADGGRVYATATMVMCLQVYYRYDRVFWVK